MREKFLTFYWMFPSPIIGCCIGHPVSSRLLSVWYRLCFLSIILHICRLDASTINTIWKQTFWLVTKMRNFRILSLGPCSKSVRKVSKFIWNNNCRNRNGCWMGRLVCDATKKASICLENPVVSNFSGNFASTGSKWFSSIVLGLRCTRTVAFIDRITNSASIQVFYIGEHYKTTSFRWYNPVFFLLLTHIDKYLFMKFFCTQFPH